MVGTFLQMRLSRDGPTPSAIYVHVYTYVVMPRSGDLANHQPSRNPTGRRYKRPALPSLQ